MQRELPVRLPVYQPEQSLGWWRLTAVAQVTGVVLRLVVHSHVVGDVRSGQQLPADVTRHLLLVTDQVGAEAVPRGKR